MKHRPELTQELLKDFVHYDPKTGILKRTHALDRSQNRYKKEFIPKSVTAQGYRQISLFKKPHLVHRLAFLYMTGEFPIEVDHINGDRLDNRWINLREATPSINRKNMGVPTNNKSGARGVYWYPRYGKWEVTIQVDGQHKYLGRFADYDEAVKVRQQAESEHGFHNNHGKRDSWR